MFSFIKKSRSLITVVIITLVVILGSLSGALQNPSVFLNLMQESVKLNISVAFGFGAIVIACLIFQNKTQLKVNKDKYFDYIGVMFYFILINLGTFYLSYFPKHNWYQTILIIYFALSICGIASLLFATARVLGTVFNKESL